MGRHATTVFNWGRIEWLYEPDTADTANPISIGIQTISPGRTQAKHVHHGDEQFLYVLSGTGREVINGKASIKGAGSFFHIAEGFMHETENIGDEPLRELIISTPANHESHAAVDAAPSHAGISQHKFFSDVEKSPGLKEIFRNFTDKHGLPVAYFNMNGKAIVRAGNFPERCHLCKTGNKNRIDCAIYSMQDSGSDLRYTKPKVFVCKHGLSVILCTVVCGANAAGMIKGGHMMIVPEDLPEGSVVSSLFNMPHELPDTQFYSKARVNAVLKQFERLNKEVGDYYNRLSWSFEVARRESSLKKIMNEGESLRETLRSKTEQVLNIRISNHFLFNTLNAIGSMAVAENAFDTYDAILNLSNMFRYTLRTDYRPVRLSEEIAGLRDYLNLQQLRFGDRISVSIRIPEEISHLELPFHCLQPIVENSFIHGFKDSEKPLRISVTGKLMGDRAFLTVTDNGAGMDKESLNNLRRGIKANGGADASGLSMMYEKLKSCYSDGFAFKVRSAPHKGMRVEITLPLTADMGRDNGRMRVVGDEKSGNC
jgi:quercetin dioxygenase-like cupin family protein/ligand-binding sensor protein